MLKKLFDCCKDNKQDCCKNHKGNSDNPIYAFGIFGSLIYFWQMSDPNFSAKIVAILKALLWPGVLAYELLKFIGA